MPLYEYDCTACGERFDRLTTTDSADSAACPKCGSVKVKRLLSVIAGLGGRADAPAPVCGRGACPSCS